MYVQANYGGIKGKLPSEAGVEQTAPKMVEDKTGDSDEEEPTKENEELNPSDSEDEPEIEMNWNIMQFLPEAGACQTNFNVSHNGLCSSFARLGHVRKTLM